MPGCQMARKEGGRKKVAKNSPEGRVTIRKVQKKRMRKNRLVVKLPWKKNKATDTKEKQQDEIKDLEVLREIIQGEGAEKTNQPRTKAKKVEVRLKKLKVEVRLNKLKVKQVEEGEDVEEELPASTGQELESEMITMVKKKADALDKDLRKTNDRAGSQATNPSSSKALGKDEAKTMGKDGDQPLGKDEAQTLGKDSSKNESCEKERGNIRRASHKDESGSTIRSKPSRSGCGPPGGERKLGGVEVRLENIGIAMKEVEVKVERWTPRWRGVRRVRVMVARCRAARAALQEEQGWGSRARARAATVAASSLVWW